MSSLEISQGLYRQAIIIKYHWKTPLAKYLRILMANESISVWPVGHAVEVLCDWQQVDWVWYPQDPPPRKNKQLSNSVNDFRVSATRCCYWSQAKQNLTSSSPKSSSEKSFIFSSCTRFWKSRSRSRFFSLTGNRNSFITIRHDSTPTRPAPGK